MAMRGGQLNMARAALEGLVTYAPLIVENPTEVLAKIGLFAAVSKPVADQLMAGMTALNK